MYVIHYCLIIKELDHFAKSACVSSITSCGISAHLYWYSYLLLITIKHSRLSMIWWSWFTPKRFISLESVDDAVSSLYEWAFVKNQNWQLRIITEARTKFTSPPLQKTKRLMLSDLTSVTPKVHIRSLQRSPQRKAEKDVWTSNQWIWLQITGPLKAYFRTVRHSLSPLPPPHVNYGICFECKIWILSGNSVQLQRRSQKPASFRLPAAWTYDQSCW